jgi:hypothetical protein
MGGMIFDIVRSYSFLWVGRRVVRIMQEPAGRDYARRLTGRMSAMPSPDLALLMMTSSGSRSNVVAISSTWGRISEAIIIISSSSSSSSLVAAGDGHPMTWCCIQIMHQKR